MGESRYKLKESDTSDDDVSIKGPIAKVIRYLPIFSRFKILFSNLNGTKNIIWHAYQRKYEGNFFHVAYSLQ